MSCIREATAVDEGRTCVRTWKIRSKSREGTQKICTAYPVPTKSLPYPGRSYPMQFTSLFTGRLYNCCIHRQVVLLPYLDIVRYSSMGKNSALAEPEKVVRESDKHAKPKKEVKGLGGKGLKSSKSKAQTVTLPDGTQVSCPYVNPSTNESAELVGCDLGQCEVVAPITARGC